MNRRWFAFLAVGVLGFGLQAATLGLLVRIGWRDLVATTAAVTLAIFHNFVWHQRWTWADRTVSRREMLERLLWFAMTNGAASLFGTVGFTALYAGLWGLPTLAANALAVVSTSLANFLIADRWVFSGRR